MIFLLCISGLLFFSGIGLSIPGFQFYMGQRRDLYFHAEHSWTGMLRLGGALLIMGAGIFAGVGFSGMLNHWMLVFTGMGVMFLWWVMSPYLLIWFPPRWVRELEEGRSLEELNAVIQNGSAMLYRYPSVFPMIIRNQAGWETWLTTVSGYIPLVNLEIYAVRAKQAMERHLYPIAIVAAENIIKYRPDQATGYALRGQAYFQDHRYEAALSDYTKAIELQPHDATLFYQRARLYLIFNQHQAAWEDINQAILLQPDVTEWHSIREMLMGKSEELKVKS